MPLHPGSSRGIISNNIREMMAAGHPQAQAVAASLSNARRHPRKSSGGEVEPAFHEMSEREKTTSGLHPYLGTESPPRYQEGGGIMGMPPDIAPSSGTMNPLEQSAIQRYQAMSPQQLQQLSMMLGATPQGQMVQRVLQAKRMMPNVGVSATPMMAGGGDVPHMQMGGIPISMADPPWERHQQTGAPPATGFLLGSTPGRADQVNVSPPAGSYVWPADVIAGLGEGNSLAGAAILQKALHTGPRGTPLPPGVRGPGVPIPRPPPRFTEPLMGPAAQHGGRLNGQNDHKGERTPIMAAHGEYISPPEEVRLWGRGNLKRGHDIFDQAVLGLRQKQIATLKKLKGPVKS